MAPRPSRSIFEKLLYLGIATFFLWPFVQLWSIKAVPLVDSDTHLRASVMLENLLEDALAMPFDHSRGRTAFQAIPGAEDIGLIGRTEFVPHPDFENMYIMRAQVRWGYFPFIKSLNLEKLVTRTRP